MPAVTIEIDSAQAQAMLRAAPGKIKSRLNRVLNVVSIETQREMRTKANVGVSGDLRRSIKYQVTGLESRVGPTAASGPYVEKGTRPHWTSVKPETALGKWAAAKGVNPYMLQRSIARKGTKAHPFVEPTYTLMEPRITRRFDSEIDKLVQELNA